MGAAASSSSSSAPPQKKYDVFISFRGEDTRSNFTSHLHTALCQKGIETYIDYRLQKGDLISQSLIQAIEDSSISVVVFSHNYASSKWCLDELVQILECKKYLGQVVIPVFYKVDPSDVRKQNGSYKEAFTKHEADFIHDQEKVNKWKEALFETANLAGWDSQTYRDESELIQDIVIDVLQKLNLQHPMSALKGLIGIEENCESIELLLEKVPVIGIWGMGGIGKTTMAKAVFAKLSSQYESCCFLENLREESEKHNMSYVCDKLLFELGMENNLYGYNTPRVVRSSYVRRLRSKKVLIVLDDVNSSMQLEYLAQECDCLGTNSRVIITTRDRHLLIGRANAIYEAKALNYEASFELFSLKAFHKNHFEIGYENLSKRAVDYAKGIPLALVVLGSFLHSKTTKEWESALEKLKKTPNEVIQQVLKLSYDGLDHNERKIFLDIACFLKGETEKHVRTLLDSFGFHACIGLRTLVDRALITIDSRVWMHDLIQQMGWEIVYQECINEPGRRSRLRDPEEIYDVLNYNKGTDAVEAIILNMSQIRRYINLRADTFKKMTNLRFLKFFSSEGRTSFNVNFFPSGFESFSDKLSYFHWDDYPLESLPSTFNAYQLVELHMENSRIKKLWDGVKDFVNLRRINLSGSSKLIELPDFSKAKNLEMVNLSRCDSLSNVHPSILSLHTLVTLNLDECRSLRTLQSENHLKSLTYLDVTNCRALREFSLSSEKLTELSLVSTGIETLHSSIGRFNILKRLCLKGSFLKSLPIKELSCLTSIEDLRLSDCRKVIDELDLQILFEGLRSLEYLYLDGCINLLRLPHNISNLLSLYVLELQGSSIGKLPSTLRHLSNLKRINLSNCMMLQFIPELPPCLTHLDAKNCMSLKTVLASTTSILQNNKRKGYILSFSNCVKLDKHSFVMEFAQFSMKGAVYNNCRTINVCYPGSKVPEWFGYKQIIEASKRTITIELDPPFDDLKGFLFCSILSRLISEESFGGNLICQCSLEDDENVKHLKQRGCQFSELQRREFNFDHVFLWYEEFHFERATCNRKFTFHFYVGQFPGQIHDLSKFITACGLCPIFDSEYHNFVQQMELELGTESSIVDHLPQSLELELGMQTKRPLNIDEQVQLPPTKKSKEKIDDLVPPELELELATKPNSTLHYQNWTSQNES